MNAVLYVLAGVVIVTAGVVTVLGLAAVLVAGECSQDERNRGWDA